MDTKDAGSTGAYGRAASTNLLAEARKLAHSQASVSYNPKLSENKAKHVAPVSVVVERPDQLGETREHLLYKLGDSSWDAKQAANRMAWTLGIQEKDEKAIEEEFQKVMKSFSKHVAAAQNSGNTRITERRVLLPVYVRKGDLVLKDECEFDVGAGLGSGSTLATAVQQYAATVCHDLGLGSDWWQAITKEVAPMLAVITDDLRSAPGEVTLLPPLDPGDAVRKAPGGPRLQPVDAAEDAVVQERVRQREERLAARRKRLDEGQLLVSPTGPSTQAGTPGGPAGAG